MIFDFFRKKERKAVTDINDFILKKENQLLEENKKTSESIKILVLTLNQKLSEDLLNLQTINLDEKRVEQKIKLIVKDNFEKYKVHLANFIKNLESITYSEVSEIISSINDIFSDFEKKSLLNYEKSTFLIGKELGKVKADISDFFKYMKQSVNPDILKESEKINQIKKKLNEIGVINNLIKESESGINSLNEKIALVENENENLKDKISLIKDSEEYLDEWNKKVNLDKVHIEIENLLNEIKISIDFKELANNFHTDQKKMLIINSYKDNFKESFKKDMASQLLPLIQKNMNITPILEKINQINKKIEESQKLKSTLNGLKNINQIEQINEEIRKNHLYSKGIEQDIIQISKKVERFNETKAIINTSIKKDLEEMNISVE